MICPKCRKELREGAKFCPSCGTRVSNHQRNRRFRIFIIVILILGAILGGVGIGILAPRVVGNSNSVPEIHGAEEAIAYAKELGADLGYKNAMSELTEKVTTEFDGDCYYRLQQNYLGIPVYGRAVICVTDENDKLIALTGNVLDVDESIDTTPTIAIQTVRSYIEKYVVDTLGLDIVDYSVNVMPDYGLIWYSTSSVDSALAYNVTAYIEDKPYEVIVDAHEGTVYKASCQIQTESIPITLTLSGHEQDVNVWKESNGKYIAYDAERNMRWQSANGETLTVSIIFKDVSGAVYRYDIDLGKWYDINGREVDVPSGAPSSKMYDFSTKQNVKGVTQPRFDSIASLDDDVKKIMFFVAVSDDYFSETLSREGWGDDRMKSLEVIYDCSGSTSYHQQLVDGDSLLCILSNSGLNVVSHELTHALERSICGLEGTGESGAIREALCDLFAEFIEYDFFGRCDWLYDSGVRNTVEPSLSTEANISHPSKYLGEDWIDTGNTYDNGGVHINSTVLSHATYLMSTDGGGALEISELEMLWYRAMLMMPSDCNFEECRTLVELAGESMNLSDNQIKCIKDAFDEVAIPDEKRVDYSLNVDCTLSIYGADSEPATNYTIWIDGKRLAFEKIGELDAEDIGFPPSISELWNYFLIDYSDSKIVTAAEAFKLDLPVGVYTITLQDNADSSRIYTFKVSVTVVGGLDNLDIFTNFGKSKLLKQAYEYLNGELQDVTLFKYDEKGLISESSHHSFIEGARYNESRVTFLYDEYGRMIEQRHYLGPSDEYERRKNTYNESGQLSQQDVEVSRSKGTITYEYDERGQLVKTVTKGDNERTVTLYDEDGNPAVSEYYDDTGMMHTYEQEYRYITLFDGEYPPFTVEASVSKTYDFVESLSLVLEDTVGNWIASFAFSDVPELITDDDGYLISASNIEPSGSVLLYEFYYDGDELPQTEASKLEYPISEEDCYTIYKNYFGYDMKSDDLTEICVDRFGKGDQEALYFSIYRYNESNGGNTLQGVFIVYVNTGECLRDDIFFHADDYYP